MTQTRQLAAIMFTDIVGYTALMGNDERKAFEFLDKNRRIQKPIIEEFNGKWIKELGDGVMSSFTTISDAVNAAIKIQRSCSEAKYFQLRIGIHLGEVVFDNNDVFGDGVNIASRIQAIANPGSIFISETVHNNLANKKEFQTKYFTVKQLKNVKQPVKIYQVIADGVVAAHLPVVHKIGPRRKILPWLLALIIFLAGAYYLESRLIKSNNELPGINAGTVARSIAVLPFVNISADSSDEYFSDGITESLMTDLGQIPGLTVIARNTTFQYKGKNVNPVEIGDQLNVGYILQGTIQHAGQQFRINTQLIETKSGHEIWTRKFDNKMENVFSVQDSISGYIVDQLKLAIQRQNSKPVAPPTKNLEAYEYYLRGYYLIRKNAANNRENIDSAISLFERAVSLDPEFALAYAALGRACGSLFFIYDRDTKWESKAFVNIEKALSLDPEMSEAYLGKADLTWTLANGFPHEKAVALLKHALDLNPNLVDAHESLGSIYFHIGLFDKAMEQFKIALTLDPAGNFTKPRIARIYWYEQKFDLSLRKFSSIEDLGPGWSIEMALVYRYLGRTDEAFKILREVSKTQRNNADLAAGYSVLYAGTGKRKEAEEKIEFAISHGEGVSHFHHAEYLIGSAYALMDNVSASVEWLRKAADHGLPCYPLFKNDPNLKNLRKDPGYQSLMQNLKKQWEKYMATL